jgi:protoheme IX farnesyltransferase
MPFKDYYALTKPGIIYGNALTLIGGFLLASKWHIDLLVFLAALLGTSLVIASGCVFNNYLDRHIDKKMARTSKRALASGKISARNALIYASVLGMVGFLLLGFLVNGLVVGIGLVGFVDYVILYGFWKRRSPLGTIIGSVSGATPVLAGYCAARGHLDAGAIIVFLIMVFWQMPHFYAIAMYRLKDYTAASIPVLPAVKGMMTTKRTMLVYIIGYMGANIALTLYGYTGYIYAVVMSVYGLMWLQKSIHGLRVSNDDTPWARKMFFFSLIGILLFTAMLSVGALLP